MPRTSAEGCPAPTSGKVERARLLTWPSKVACELHGLQCRRHPLDARRPRPQCLVTELAQLAELMAHDSTTATRDPHAHPAVA